VSAEKDYSLQAVPHGRDEVGQLVEGFNDMLTRIRERDEALRARLDENTEAQKRLEALNRALEGITGTSAVHICFGYAAVIHQKPSGYSFLPEFAGCSCQQVSIEAAQPGLDCSVLSTLKNKKIMIGCIDLNDMTVETAETVVARIKRALPYVPKENVILAPDCGMKYLPREVAFGKMKAMVEAAKILRAEFGAKP
jgi:5-methyltetrahydropteroyltriglutamate--homocysteine methyltransferase